MQYGLIGEKLGHSFSKEIHEQLANYTYDLHPLTKEEFLAFMENKEFKAINVTIPYKKDVIPYLDVIDKNAETIGAVNTIVNKDGKLHGYNTDYDGFLYMIKKHHINLCNKKVLILGNGGACAAVKAVVKNMQAKEMILVSRSANNGAISYEECFKNHLDAQVIINTTPVGMYPNNDDCPIDLDLFPLCSAVIDVIYNPLITTLCMQAKEKNIPYVMGLEMLVAQAKYAVEHFLDIKLEDQCIDKIYKDMLLERTNIVLIGMPSAGKTTVGKLLSKKMNRSYIDIDEEIIKDTHMSIPAIFETSGEAGFREIETLTTKKVAKQNNSIICCGGGIIKKKENMTTLKQNGICFFLDRDLSLLVTNDPNRPLSSSKEAIKAMYKERYPLYMNYADICIDNNTSLENAVERISDTFTKYILESEVDEV